MEMMPQKPSLPRCLAVVLAGTGLVALASLWLAPVAASLPAAAGGHPASAPADALVALCALVALVAVTWLWVLTVLVVAGAARGRVQGVRGVPVPLRRLVLAACGVALAGGLAVAPATATPGNPHQDRGPAATLTGLPLPDRAATPARPETEVVVVHPGDTLWAIAGRSLGPGATNTEIDARWHRVHELNRDVIGPDPDLIRPAQRLRVPLT